jgi:YegS/Rv2252/BmrU family lipid kinase
VSSERRHLLLVNPHSAGGRTIKLLPEVERELESQGLRYRVVQTTSLEHGVSEARIAADSGEIPVVMSGDGLIGQVGGALAGGETPLGMIPGGRGNDLARVLGIPKDPADSVAVLAKGEDRPIDVGEVNGRHFLCIASCGFDSDANRIANEAKLVRGNLVYAYAALRALIAWKPARFTLELDGKRVEIVGTSVAVANSKAYGGGMFIAPDAELDDGRFDVVLTGDASKWHFLINLPKVFKGTHVENEEIQVLRASEVSVTADRPFAVYADGEHIAELPARLSTLPGALRVIAPPAPA